MDAIQQVWHLTPPNFLGTLALRRRPRYDLAGSCRSESWLVQRLDRKQRILWSRLPVSSPAAPPSPYCPLLCGLYAVSKASLRRSRLRILVCRQLSEVARAGSHVQLGYVKGRSSVSGEALQSHHRIGRKWFETALLWSRRKPCDWRSAIEFAQSPTRQVLAREIAPKSRRSSILQPLLLLSLPCELRFPNRLVSWLPFSPSGGRYHFKMHTSWL